MIEKINVRETKNKILEIMKVNGPCLPIHISQQLKLSTILSSALLSELLSEKIIKISNLKVGGSPLYYLPGQEVMLEKFYTYLPTKEKEAFLLLKEKKILEDEKLEPSIRVALRNIKDFSFPMVLNTGEDKIVFWRFYAIPETQAKEELDKLVNQRLQETQQPIKNEVEVKPKLKEPSIEESKKIEKSLITLKPVKKTKKSEFVNQIVSFIKSNNIELLEENYWKKKEYSSIIRVNSDLGKIKFLCVAKDKKVITENDLVLALQNAQSLKLPLFIISKGNPNKKALSYLEQYSSLIKFKKLG